jgi:hypothetical protein
VRNLRRAALCRPSDLFGRTLSIFFSEPIV